MAREERSLGAARETVNEGTSLWTELAALVGSLVHRRTSPEGPARIAAVTLRRLGASRAAVFGRRPGRPGLVIEGSAGFDALPDRIRLLDYGRRLANWVERTHAPLLVTAPLTDLRFEEAPEGVTQARAFPLSIGDQVLGALVVFDGAEDSPSSLQGEERDIAFLALSQLAALCLDRDRQEERAITLSRDLEEHERRLAGAERRAAAAELASDIGREIEEPLAGMAGLASRVAESLDAGDPRRALLERVVEETTRLARLVAAPEEFLRGAPGHLEPDTLNRVMSESLALVRTDLTQAGIRLTERLGSSLPFLLLDADLVRRVFLNMLRAGIASATPGGRLKVETKRRGDTVEVSVAADGVAVPGRVLETLWAPFHPEGTSGDPAPGAVRKLVRDHRVTLRSTATRDWPFSICLMVPIPGNQDRRRGGRDRRTQ